MRHKNSDLIEGRGRQLCGDIWLNRRVSHELPWVDQVAWVIQNHGYELDEGQRQQMWSMAYGAYQIESDESAKVSMEI